jgi:hypothetical protein
MHTHRVASTPIDVISAAARAAPDDGPIIIVPVALVLPTATHHWGTRKPNTPARLTTARACCSPKPSAVRVCESGDRGTRRQLLIKTTDVWASLLCRMQAGISFRAKKKSEEEEKSGEVIK